jgi:large subunit ribosomal protein L4
MPEISVREKSGAPSGRSVELPDGIFARKMDKNAVYQAVVAHQINRAQGTASTKTRAEVSGGGRKPYRQKGTGRARQGSTRAPHYTGGGVVHGPRPGKKRRELPKRTRRAAICSVLSDRQVAGEVYVVEPIELDEPKTKVVAEMLGGMGLTAKKVLLVLDVERPGLYRSARNIPGVEVRVAPSFSVTDVLVADAVVLVEGAAEKLAEVWS